MREPLAIGMHGFGYIGRIHFLALTTCRMAQLDVNIQWKRCFVRDKHSEAYELACEVFDEVVVDDGGVLDLSGLDVIDITSPNHLHARVAIQAAEQGTHVYCEKPLSHVLSESLQMERAVTGAGIVHQVALMNRFHPGVEKAYAVLQSGVLGRVLTFRGATLHGGYLSHSRPYAWRLDKSRAGAGALMDLGVHMLDLVLFLLGPVRDVHSILRTYVGERQDSTGIRHAVDVDDWGSLQIVLEDGAAGTVEVSRVHYGAEENSLTVVCEHGTIQLDLTRVDGVQFTLLDGTTPTFDGALALSRLRLSPKYATDVMVSNHATGLLAFLEEVRHRRGQPADMERQGTDGSAFAGYPLPGFADAVRAERVIAQALQDSGDL